MPDSIKLKGLFLNTEKENCSIHESGNMCFNNLKDSEKYQLDYAEISAHSTTINATYDFYIINYHPWKMDWLDTTSLRNLTGKKYAIVLEVSPGNPFVYGFDKNFDGFMVLDPTIKKNHPKVFPFARPLELDIPVTTQHTSTIPIIGSFGFPTPGKGFELLIDAVNKEFDNAIVRINVPPVNQSTYDNYKQLFKIDYTDYLEQLCNKVASSSIRVEFSREYFTKEKLINWCAANTLNCFMYNRFQSGLSATTDQAIVSGCPLAVSSNETFRHIHQYITPYPFRSLRDSIKYSGVEVQKMKQSWSAESFQQTFESMLERTGSKPVTKRSKLTALKVKTTPVADTPLLLDVIDKTKRKAIDFVSKTSSFYRKNSLKSFSSIFNYSNYLFEMPERNSGIENILFVSHSSKKCGIHEFGWNLKEVLKKSIKYNYYYTECNNQEELAKSIAKSNPAIVVYNYYPATMSWLSKEVLLKHDITNIGYVHEFDHLNFIEKIDSSFFEYNIFPDPSLDLTGFSNCFKTGRLLANYQNYINLPDITTIGSFGFGFHDKGFEKLVATVQNEFDEAIIHLIMSFSDVIDPDGTKMVLPTAQRCREIITKKGIQLKIDHKYLSKNEILDFLASNTINAFLYNSEKKQGISSVLDYALSVQRPVAISSAGMFRHMAPISHKITIENNNLQCIINEGIAPLVPFYNEWNEPKNLMTYDSIMSTVLENKRYATLTSDNTVGLNL